MTTEVWGKVRLHAVMLWPGHKKFMIENNPYVRLKVFVILQNY